MSEFLKTQAIILRRTNYGEADRILSILTPNHGKISVMARGVRKEKSRLAGGIELFAICDLNLTKSAQNVGEIWTLTGSKLNKFFAQIMTDYDKLQFGYDAIKLIARAAETVDEPDFFDLLKDVFVALDETKIALKITETWFYLNLAKLLGNEMNLARDARGMKLVEDANYNFLAHDQVFEFSENGRFDAKAIKLLRVMTSNRPDVVARISGISEYLDDCLNLARIVAKI